MVTISSRSPGVRTSEIDRTASGPTGPSGTPAGIIGTTVRGPAFIPVTLASLGQFRNIFGSSDGEKYGPLAAQQWLKRANALVYLRLLGVGKGEKRLTTGGNIGSVESAGFVVGEQQVLATGNFGNNPYAVLAGSPGRTYILGCYMSESAGSTVFSEANIQNSTTAHPILRGVIFAASGVLLRLSSSLSGSNAPSITAPAREGLTSLQGGITGTVNLSNSKQEFVMLLNGHVNSDASYPNVVTASFDVYAPNYFGNILNTDPYKLQEAGHYLYAKFDVQTALATVTGSGITSGTVAANEIAFLTTSSLGRNVGSSIVPNFENFEDRFSAPKTPWIISQRFGGTPKNLFRFHALSDGTGEETSLKVSIENVTPSSSEKDKYGTFDVIIRDYNDTDEDKIVLESYRGISLNPLSDRYIGRLVGDSYKYFDFEQSVGNQVLVNDGKYENASNRVRVEISTEVDDGDIEPEALPSGFRGKFHLATSGSAPLTSVGGPLLAGASDILKRTVEPPLPLRKNIAIGVSPRQIANKNLYWGIQFERNISITEPNSSRVADDTVTNFTKYFPNFMTSNINVWVGDNNGATDSATNGILDSDRFNRNLFSLENIQVVTGSDGKADSKVAEQWSYIRAGSIAANETNKTRALSIATDLTIPANRNLAKFSLFFQGGFDGVNIFNRDEKNINNNAIVEEMNFSARGQNNGPTVKTWRKALDIIGIDNEVDINILTTPGMRHSIITDYGITTADNRFDSIYIMDIEERDTLDSVVTSSITQNINVLNTVNAHAARSINTSFAAAYFPDVHIQDIDNDILVQVPPSVAIIGALAQNDALGHPWTAPAGFTRGALADVRRAAVRLNQTNLDNLYDVDINPIVAFEGGAGGVKVWGQKTLSAEQNSLDRVNVRRMMLELRRRVKRVANDFLFEPNREETLNRFAARINPILATIRAQQGIERYNVQIDASTTTQADIDNLTIRGVITVQPTRTGEIVQLDFVATNRNGFQTA